MEQNQKTQKDQLCGGLKEIYTEELKICLIVWFCGEDVGTFIGSERSTSSKNWPTCHLITFTFRPPTTIIGAVLPSFEINDSGIQNVTVKSLGENAILLFDTFIGKA